MVGKTSARRVAFDQTTGYRFLKGQTPRIPIREFALNGAGW